MEPYYKIKKPEWRECVIFTNYIGISMWYYKNRAGTYNSVNSLNACSIQIHETKLEAIEWCEKQYYEIAKAFLEKV